MKRARYYITTVLSIATNGTSPGFNKLTAILLDSAHETRRCTKAQGTLEVVGGIGDSVCQFLLTLEFLPSLIRGIALSSKRVLSSQGYYTSLATPHVKLVLPALKKT